MKLNLSGWKKLKEDSKHAILCNPQGHEIKIAKNALSPKFRSQLASLPSYAEGGEVKKQPLPDKRKQDQELIDATQNDELARQTMKESLPQMAEGGDPQDTKPPTAPVTINIGQPQQANAPIPPPNGGMSGAALDQYVTQNPGPMATTGSNPAAEEAMANQTPSQDDEQAPEQPQAPAPQQQQAAPQAPAPQAPAPTPTPTPTPTPFEAAKNSEMQQYAQEDAAWQHDLNNGHVTPETYHQLFAKKDTLSKLGTMFGLMLGGMGSGLTHQPNAVMEMMNREIQNDLDAQAKSKSNAQNLINLNNQRLVQQAQAGQINIDTKTKAYALANMQANRTALHLFTEQVKKMPPGSPQRMQAEQTLAILSQSINNENYQIADRLSSLAALNSLSGPSANSEEQFQAQNTALRQSGHADLAQNREERHINGIPGQASRPIPQANRDEVQAMNVLDNKAADILAFAKAHKGTLSPSQRAIGEQKAEEMINFYNNSIKGGVLTEGRLDWLDKQIHKNPTSIFQDILGNNSRLREIQNSNNQRRSILLKGLGYSNPSSESIAAPQQSSAQLREGATGTYKGKPVIVKNGKWQFK
jgi:hypothetical protein